MSSGNLKKIKNFLSKNILQQHLRLNTNTRPRKNLGFIAATKMYCEERMETEETTCKSLGKRTDYKIKKNTLKLFYNKGNLLLELQKEKRTKGEREKNKVHFPTKIYLLPSKRLFPA